MMKIEDIVRQYAKDEKQFVEIINKEITHYREFYQKNYGNLGLSYSNYIMMFEDYLKDRGYSRNQPKPNNIGDDYKPVKKPKKKR